MDFQTLIKQAANIQASKQKELETKKKVNETEKQRTKLQEIDKKRESKKRLGQYEQETIKSRLMYHGLASSSGSPLKHVATPSASTSTTTTSKATTSLNKNSQRHLQTPGSIKSKETHKGVKGKSFSPLPSTMKQKNAGKITKTSSNSSTLAKSKTPPRGKLKSSTMPTDFQELLKIAQRNSSSNKTSSNTPLSNNTKSPSQIIQKPSGSVSIGVGRSLLDKSSRLDRHRSMMEASASKQQNGDSFVNQEKRLLVNEGTKKNNSVLPYGKRQIDKNKISPGQKGTQIQPQSSDKERVNPYPRPYPRPYESDCGQQLDSEKSRSVTKSNGPSPKISNGIGTQIRGRGNNSQVRGRGGMRGRGASSDRSRNPNRFYSASARLISDGPSGRVPMLGYRSTWADEMSEYLRNNEYQLEEEDDGEFDDFVVDDDGYGGVEYGDEGGEDYSSAIRSIFGDRYLSGPNNYDDEVMESSFAQQQFEEMRSARIGRIEDEEDIKREKEMERKRQQKITNNTSSKKARLK